MGQRSQIIVKLPAYDIYDNNPNNRAEEYLIFHNQWLYGFGFVNHLRDIIEYFNKLKKHNNKGLLGEYSTDYKELIQTAIKCANYKDVTNIRRTNNLFEEEENVNNWIARCGSWKKVFSSLDNNNGFIFIEISETGVLSFEILNGLEDGETIEHKTINEYVRLFYNTEQLQGSEKDIKKIEQEIQKYNKLNYKYLMIPETEDREFKVTVTVDVWAKNEEEAQDEGIKNIKVHSYFDNIEVSEVEP